MQRFRSVGRATWLASVVIASVVVSGAVVLGAAIPGADGVIRGCYESTNGMVRIVASPSDCRNQEIAIFWNETGPQGPMGDTGAIGPQGPKGDTGAQGPAGLTDAFASYKGGPVSVRTTDTFVRSNTASYAIDALDVSAGKYVIIATAWFGNDSYDGNAALWCGLNAGGEERYVAMQVQPLVMNSVSALSATLTDVHEFTSNGRIDFFCFNYSLAPRTVWAREITINAVRVGNLSIQYH